VILDASAVLAFLLAEPGEDRVKDALLSESMMTTVNFAEVVTKYVLRGATAEARKLQDQLPVTLIAVDEELALDAALIAAITKPYGLSLGDRICLALGRRAARPILTADRQWLHVAGALGVVVETIR
jgi:ribonuclease VapC